MMRPCFICVLFVFFWGNALVFAQDEDVRSAVDYKVNKMQKVLNLTDSQADAIKPVIKEYLTKRQTVLDATVDQGIVDHVAVKSTLKGLKEIEYQKLSRILSADQLKKWIEKENLMAALNPDGVESAVDDGGASMTATGVDFKF
jgi:uncharacterized protein (DUF2252 family)